MFEDVEPLAFALTYLAQHAVDISDTAVLMASETRSDPLSAPATSPAVFRRVKSGQSRSWVHTGTAASFTGRFLGTPDAWASDRTAQEIETELDDGHVVLLIYGLRNTIQALVTGVLIDLAVLRVELHDIPEIGRSMGPSES